MKKLIIGRNRETRLPGEDLIDDPIQNNTKRLNVNLDETLYRDLKLLCYNQDIPI